MAQAKLNTPEIMNAIWTGEPSVVYGNVRNDNLIDNLPQGCCVEVACLVDANGIQPTKVGALPAHLAALMQTNINVQTLLAAVAGGTGLCRYALAAARKAYRQPHEPPSRRLGADAALPGP